MALCHAVISSVFTFPGDSILQGNAHTALHLPVVKFIYLRQVAKQHVSFVLQGWGDEVAEFRVVQLCEITLGTRVKRREEEKDNRQPN